MAEMSVGTVIAILLGIMGTQVMILVKMVTPRDLETKLQTHRKRYHKGD